MCGCDTFDSFLSVPWYLMFRQREKKSFQKNTKIKNDKAKQNLRKQKMLFFLIRKIETVQNRHSFLYTEK